MFSQKPTFMEKAAQGVEGYKKAGKKALKKSKEWGAATKQGLDNSAAAYNNQLAHNKAKAEAAESYNKFKTALPTVMQEGGRRTRRRRKSRKGRRRRKRRRTRRRRRKKRTKRRRRR